MCTSEWSPTGRILTSPAHLHTTRLASQVATRGCHQAAVTNTVPTLIDLINHDWCGISGGCVETVPKRGETDRSAGAMAECPNRDTCAIEGLWSILKDILWSIKLYISGVKWIYVFSVTSRSHHIVSNVYKDLQFALQMPVQFRLNF